MLWHARRGLGVDGGMNTLPDMEGADRLLRVVNRLKKLHDEAKSDLEREAIEGLAQELAGNAEINLSTLTGFSLPLIRRGLVTE